MNAVENVHIVTGQMITYSLYNSERTRNMSSQTGPSMSSRPVSFYEQRTLLSNIFIFDRTRDKYIYICYQRYLYLASICTTKVSCNRVPEGLACLANGDDAVHEQVSSRELRRDAALEERLLQVREAWLAEEHRRPQRRGARERPEHRQRLALACARRSGRERRRGRGRVGRSVHVRGGQHARVQPGHLRLGHTRLHQLERADQRVRQLHLQTNVPSCKHKGSKFHPHSTCTIHVPSQDLRAQFSVHSYSYCTICTHK